MRTLPILLSLVLCAASGLRAQGVVVAPHVVVIDHRTRSASITLYNPGNEPAEVELSSFFGYPVTDADGDFELATPAEPGALPSAAEWVEAYPRRMVIGPLERQTVRLLARAPGGLADGEYWSRVMITARGGTVPVAMADTIPGIQVGLDLEVRTIIPLQYRKGPVTTGVDVQDLRAERGPDASVIARARLTRQGSAAFVGTAILRLYDASGAQVLRHEAPLAVYTEADPRFELGPVRGSGPFRLDIELLAERSDLAREQLVPAEPVHASVTVHLP
ncbi:MAG: hypothetical protein R3E98_08680 [Gemmatimonadota bacterium]|nr:hypothetical protein [Gemmatimonadota bacterium]